MSKVNLISTWIILGVLLVLGCSQDATEAIREELPIFIGANHSQYINKQPLVNNINQDTSAGGEQNEFNVISGEDTQVDTHSIPGVGLSIIFIFGSLLYGAILKVFSRVISVPYNPLLLISGIILGLYYKNLGMLGDSVELVSEASPSGILAMFLPILIFQSSFTTQWHVFKKLAGQSLIMGILSTLVSASLIMLLVKLYLDSEAKFYGWQDAFIMGSILSCTDILSFVNRLRRAGTPQKMTALLQGQSLFNYCTCVLIVDMMHYYRDLKEPAHLWAFLQLLVIQVGGGMIFGVAVGILAVYCIKRMIYDGILVVALMVIFTYSIYLIAQFSTLQISGIVSLAVFALYMNASGKPWLFGQTQQYVSSFWSYLVFVGETNIFMIAGVMVGSTLVHLHFNQADINIYSQMFASLYIYLFAVIARFVSIAIFMKILNKLGEEINWKEIILLTFAGLKGAIGIALAMQMFKSKDAALITSYLIMVHVTANSIITFMIHGTFAGLMVKLLGLSSLKKVQYKFFKEYLFSFKANVYQRLRILKEEAKEDNAIDWEQVEKHIGLPIYSSMIKETDRIIANKKFKDQSKFQKSLMFKLQTSLKEYSRQQPLQIQEELVQKIALFDLEVQFRKRFIKDMIAKYWQFHNANQTSPAALMLLIQSANYDLDRQTEQIQSWSWIKDEISLNMRLYSGLMKLTLINTLAKSSLFQYVSFCYDVVSSYIKANEEVRVEISQFYMTSQHKNQDEEKLVLDNILRESQQNQKQAQFFLSNYLEPSFPQIQQEVKTRKVSFFILHSFKNLIDKNNQNGQLQSNQYDMLNQIIHERSLYLNLASPQWQETDFMTTLCQNKQGSIFRQLPQPVLKLICSELSQEKTFDVNEKIIDNSDVGKYFFFVKKGGVIVEFTNQKLVYKEPMLAGQVFGFQSLVTNIYHSKVTANTMAEVVQVKKSLILKIFDTFPQIEQAFWKSEIYQCYKMFQRKEEISYRISQLQKEQVQRLINNFKLRCISPQIIEELDQDMIFIRGNIEVTAVRDQRGVPSNILKKISKQYDQVVSTETALPFYFASRMVDTTIRIKEDSLFLTGIFDYEIFELDTMRLSRSTNWKLTKKKT